MSFNTMPHHFKQLLDSALRPYGLYSPWNSPGQNSWVGSRTLEKEMATHSSIFAWRIPWTEEPGGLQSTGSQRVGHDWATSLSLSLSRQRWPIKSQVWGRKMKTTSSHLWVSEPPSTALIWPHVYLCFLPAVRSPVTSPREPRAPVLRELVIFKFSVSPKIYHLLSLCKKLC